MNNADSIIKHFLVVISQTSYIEQASATNHFINLFMEYYRYQYSDKKTASLFEELKITLILSKLFTSIGLFRNMEIENLPEYDSILVTRCFLINWLWCNCDLLDELSRECLLTSLTVEPLSATISVVGLFNHHTKTLLTTNIS